MTASPAGYSGTPLPRKLGLKPGQAVAFVGVPAELASVGDALQPGRPDLVTVPDAMRTDASYDVIWAFFTRAGDLDASLPRLRSAIAPAGMIWISWPKRASKVPTDITEDVIRDQASSGGLVDVKVCAVDSIWSGLKLVIPLALRAR